MEHVNTMLFTVVVAMAAGVLLIAVAKRLELSAIVLLLLGGVLLGPWGVDVVRPQELGAGLRTLVSLAVALILFEGGLTLDLHHYRSASALIRRLLTLGVLVTWLVTAAGLWWLFGFPFDFCLLAASLVVVTGPTVIGPLLKRIKIVPSVHGVLHWEGVLIDPIGVILAIVCFEWLVIEDREAVLTRFVLRFLWGLGLGAIGGLLADRLIRSRWVPDDMVNIAALACAVLLFGGAELGFAESGLLAVTVAGLVLGIRKPGELYRIRQFKAEITDLLIGTLFILLSASLDLGSFGAFGVRGAVAVAGVMFIVRPLSVLLCSTGVGLGWRERLFLGWVAPRGIVAASMASLFSLALADKGYQNAHFLETFTYSVIAVTVVVHSVTAGGLARLLGLRRPPATGWLIVGAHRLGRAVARFIGEALGHRVVLMDTNPATVAAATAEGLEARLADARDPEIEDLLEGEGLGNLLALTDNEDLNMLLCHRWSSELGGDRLFYWATSEAEEGQRVGTAVWTRLPKPSVLSGELERGEAVLSRLVDDETDDTPLAVVYQKALNLTPEPGSLAHDEPDRALLLRREADLLANAVDSERCVDSEEAQPEALFAEMLAVAAASIPALDAGSLRAELVRREGFLPSGIGRGVAVPHTLSAAVARRVCVLARVPEGCAIKAPDEAPVQLVFLLLSPAGDQEGHLKTLAEIARTVSDDDTRSDLLTADEPADMAAVLRDYTR